MQPKAAAEFLLKAEVVATAWCVGCTHQTYGFESAKAEAGCREIGKPCQELSLLPTVVMLLALLRSPLIIRMKMAWSFPPGPGILWSFLVLFARECSGRR